MLCRFKRLREEVCIPWRGTIVTKSEGVILELRQRVEVSEEVVAHANIQGQGFRWAQAESADGSWRKSSSVIGNLMNLAGSRTVHLGVADCCDLDGASSNDLVCQQSFQ